MERDTLYRIPVLPRCPPTRCLVRRSHSRGRIGNLDIALARVHSVWLLVEPERGARRGIRSALAFASLLSHSRLDSPVSLDAGNLTFVSVLWTTERLSRREPEDLVIRRLGATLLVGKGFKLTSL